MEIKKTLLENIGFTVIGGPTLALLAYAFGLAFWGQTAGVALAVAIYGTGFLLVARRDDSGGGGGTDGLDTKKRPRQRQQSLATDSGTRGRGRHTSKTT